MGSFKKLSIKIQLFLLIFCIIVVVFFVVFFIYQSVSKIVTEKNIDYTNKIIYQIKENISSNCDVINSISYSVIYDVTVQEYLLEDDVLIRYNLYEKLIRFLSNMIDIKGGIVDIVFISNDDYSFDINGFSDLCRGIGDDFKSIGSLNPYYTGLLSFEHSGESSDYIVACSKVLSIKKNKRYGQRIGTVYVVLEPTAIIGEDYNNGDIGSYFYLMDRDKKIIYNDVSPVLETDFMSAVEYPENEVKFYSGKSGEKDSMIQFQEIEQLEGWIVCITPMNVLLKEVDTIKKLGISVLVIALILIAVPFRLISSNIINPTKRLISFMTEVSSGNLKKLKNRVNLIGYSEINVVAREFNSMLDEIDSLTHRLIETNSMLYKAELENKQSELAFLRSQINPHFLYNTFESFKGIASVKGVPEIKQMLISLSNIFKYSIKGTSLVLLREEIEIVESYIKIQKIRFFDRFEVVYEFEDEILDFKIPKMILQPIVENSVFHGLEPKLEKGHLWIGGRISEADEIIIWVKDDGIGVDSTSLKNLSDELVKNEDNDEHQESSNYSIGLKNVNNRIKLMYGKEYGIEITSVLGKYTLVLLRIPIGGDSHLQSIPG